MALVFEQVNGSRRDSQPQSWWQIFHVLLLNIDGNILHCDLYTLDCNVTWFRAHRYFEHVGAEEWPVAENVDEGSVDA